MTKIRKASVIIFLYLLIVLGAFVFPSNFEIVFTFLISIVLAVFAVNSFKIKDSRAISYFLILPVIISVFQNIYLGLAANWLNATELQILLSLHLLVMMLSFFLYILLNRLTRESSLIFLILVSILIYSLVMFIVYPVNIVAFLSSLRNIVSCFLIYGFSLCFAERATTKIVFRGIEKLSWFVIVFGFADLLFGLDLWRNLGITKLWELKGIETNLWGIPPNWYSSERFNGNIVRRMVSSFADPVNLGTFLFAAFMLAWYRKKKLLSLMLVTCSVLTVSKGALLGFLIFFVIYVFFKDKSKIFVPIIVIFTFVAGVIFVSYSKSSSSGSLMAHVNGFLNSFKVLFEHPFGLGLGRVGVMSGLFSDQLANTTVLETGLGVVIAQLGFFGLIVYLLFFYKLIKAPLKWDKKQCEEKILYFTLLLSFFANVMFNEVALSPNSCALYFIILGVLNVKRQKGELK